MSLSVTMICYSNFLDSGDSSAIGVVLASMPTESTHNALDKIAQIYIFVSLFVIAAAVVWVVLIPLFKQLKSKKA